MMPTGYTAKIHDGEEQSFEDFVLTCARAFGATIHQRDESLSPNLRPRTPSDYHANNIQSAKKAISEARGWTDTEANALAEADYERQVTVVTEMRQDRQERLNRYEAMIDKVMAWRPPAELLPLRDFMLKQLEDSIQFDCSPVTTEPQRLSGGEFRAQVIDRAKRDVDYHTTEHRKELDRCDEANRWIAALYDSLGLAGAEGAS